MRKVLWFGYSTTGNYRKRNEDYFKFYEFSEDHYFIAIADGMGGHSHGDIASKLATDFCFEFYRNNYFKKGIKTIDVLDKAVFYSHNQLRNLTNKIDEKLIVGTTLSILIIKDGKASIIHVGDTRIYLLREDNILQLTTDHSLVNSLVRQKVLTYKEADNYPRKNVLVQSIGVKVNISPQKLQTFKVEKGDIFFLSTDGLHAMFNNNEIHTHLKKLQLKEAVLALTDIALNRGSKDNVTGLAVKLL